MGSLRRISYGFWASLSVLVLASSLVASTPLSLAASSSVWSAQTMFRVKNKLTPMANPTGLTPTEIKTAYKLLGSGGGSGTIAIVDAYDDPNVVSDLDTFSSQFGLPKTTDTGFFTEHKMGAPSTDAGWALEISLDVQWAHAIAPNANILLVEASSNSLTDLLAAVDYAKSQTGVVAVSMSWGGSEFSGENTYDSHFTTSGVSFFASSGDNGAGVIWPSSSPNAIAVGGTTLTLNSDGSFNSETGWSGSGGGVSGYESKPSYQNSYGLTYSRRAVPDVSYDADPNTGVPVYDSTPYSAQSGWFQVGGTSAGAPQWAAIQSLGLSCTDSNLYSDAIANYPSFFRDIVKGSNGYSAGTGYDLVTGLGSPLTSNFVYPDFAISANPSTLNVPTSGGSPTSTITISYLNGYTGTVSLTPSSSWATFNPSSVTQTGTSTLTITVPSGTAARTYPVTVTGTSGSLAHSTTVNVIVQTPPLSATVKTDKTSYSRGQTATITVTVKSNGVAVSGATVSVKVTNPWGSSTSLQATTGADGTAQVTYKIGSTATRGTYRVTVTASKSGYSSASASTSFRVG